MVRDVAAGERAVREALAAARARRAPSVRAAAPTLENAFVAILRGLEGEARVPAFPGRPRRRARRRRARPSAPAACARVFGAFEAVKGIDLEVRYGEVYGLLGANGAGKTTTIKMLCGLIEPSAGEVRLAGEARRAALAGGAAAGRLHVAEVLALRRPDDRREPRLLRRRLRRAGRAARRRASAGCSSSPASPGRGGQLTGQPAGRLEAARGLRRGDHARAARAVPRRAHLRRRSHRAPRVLGHDQPARRPAAPRSSSPRTTWKRPSSATGWDSWSPASWWPRARRAA